MYLFLAACPTTVWQWCRGLTWNVFHASHKYWPAALSYPSKGYPWASCWPPDHLLDSLSVKVSHATLVTAAKLIVRNGPGPHRARVVLPLPPVLSESEHLPTHLKCVPVSFSAPIFPPKEAWTGQKWTLRQPPNHLQLWDKWGCTEPVCSFIPSLLLLVKGMSVYFKKITSFGNSALSEVAYGCTSFYSSPFHTNRFSH